MDGQQPTDEAMNLQQQLARDFQTNDPREIERNKRLTVLLKIRAATELMQLLSQHQGLVNAENRVIRLIAEIKAADVLMQFLNDLEMGLDVPF